MSDDDVTATNCTNTWRFWKFSSFFSLRSVCTHTHKPLWFHASVHMHFPRTFLAVGFVCSAYLLIYTFRIVCCDRINPFFRTIFFSNAANVTGVQRYGNLFREVRIRRIHFHLLLTNTTGYSGSSCRYVQHLNDDVSTLALNSNGNSSLTPCMSKSTYTNCNEMTS